MFRKVLVANRGEIACRVLHTLEVLEIPSVAVYSDADREALHVRQADEACHIGGADPADSYLNITALIRAARERGADAVHPGYGFLAENADFADACEREGLNFIGPTSSQIRRLGDKLEARAAAADAGVPVVPGAEVPFDQGDAAHRVARKLGFPLVVKAVAGGGGKGMYIVEDEAGLLPAVESAARLGQSAFGNAAVYLEKLLPRPRHVEVQVLGDGHGQALHLFERDCSLQRRHQKVMEETPSPALSEDTRSALCKAALALARAVRYRGAGTMEFLVRGDEFHFLEMNTRLQVEHPVTEWITGLDLVALQLEVAARGRLPLPQKSVTRRGCAVEARLYAEDPAAGFLPQAGRVARCEFPSSPFVRVDRGVETGSPVPVHYDPILAKVTAWAADREGAWRRLAAALARTLIHGVATNLPFLRALAGDLRVRSGELDTTFIERDFLKDYAERRHAGSDLAVVAAALSALLPAGGAATDPAGKTEAAHDPYRSMGRWRLPGLD